MTEYYNCKTEWNKIYFSDRIIKFVCLGGYEKLLYLFELVDFYLIAKDQLYEPFIDCIKNNNLELVKYMVERGVNIQSHNNSPIPRENNMLFSLGPASLSS